MTNKIKFWEGKTTKKEKTAKKKTSVKIKSKKPWMFND